MSSTALYLTIATTFVLAVILAGGFVVVPAYAEMKSSGKSLDVAVEPEWADGGNAKFKISFFNPGTNTLHQHQDYDFVIIQDGKEVYRASKQLNQPVLHNVEGTLTIPFKFTQNGAYTIKVDVLGLGLPPVPIATETHNFTVGVSPEFPAGSLGVIATLMAGAIAAARVKKLI